MATTTNDLETRDLPPFTLVTTVFNEARRLKQTLADIRAQTLLPAELIVVDAGSTDGTLKILDEWAESQPFVVRVVVKEKCNIAQGRNLAISLAENSLIASTDFGCRFHKDWLRELIAPFALYPKIELVGGAFSIIKEDVQTSAARADYILQNGYPVVQDQYFSVSSRSIAYKKEVWQRVGGYLEWLTLAADDTIFWRMCKQAGVRYHLSSFVGVFWLRHKSFKAFAKEAYRYGLGDGESGINKRNFYSALAETGLRWAIFIGVMFFWVHLFVFFWIGVVGITGPFAFRSYVRAWKNYQHLRNPATENSAKNAEKGSAFSSTSLQLKDLLNAFYLTELSRWQYFKGFLTGQYAPKPGVKEGRSKLPALPV